MRTRAAFTIIELSIAMAVLGVLGLVLIATLQQVSNVARRTASRDEALAEILRAKSRLIQDLVNSSGQPGQFASAKVGPHLGSGFDGDAITFLSSDNGNHSSQWTADPGSGQAVMASQITYYLVVPNTANNPFLVPLVAGPADAAGYEQQCPVKWLVRQVDPVAGTALNPAWTTWLTRPTVLSNSPARQIVSDALFQFRILQTAPIWTLQISAVAVRDAKKKLAVGTLPLTTSRYTITQQFTIPVHN